MAKSNSETSAEKIAAEEIARLATLGDEALQDEMDRNWLAPSDPEVYTIWMRLHEIGLGDAFQRITSATPEDLEEVNLRFELEAEGVTDDEEVEERVAEFRDQRIPFGDRFLAGEFPQPQPGEVRDLHAQLVEFGLLDVAMALPVEMLKSIGWHESFPKFSGHIPRSPDEDDEPAWPESWRTAAAEYCTRLRAEFVALAGAAGAKTATDLLNRVTARMTRE